MPLSSIEIFLLVIVSMGIPVIGHRLHLFSVNQENKGIKNARENSYHYTQLLLWIPTSLVLGYWLFSGKKFEDLGLTFQTDFWGYATLLISIAISVFFALQYFLVKNNEKAKEEVRRQINHSPGFQEFLPKSEKEYKLFYYLSVTAGITEEILFRGFLIWGFSFFMNIWLASALALFSFVLGHIYQGTATNLLKVAITGGVMTGLFLASGSLIPCIILHIIIDASNNAIVREAVKG